MVVESEENYNCDGSCINDIDGDGICDEYEIDGCTEVDPCNFDEAATEDDGSCEYAEEILIVMGIVFLI